MSDVLAFPPRNKGRKRKANSPYSMGRCTVRLIEQHGEAAPGNVFDLADFQTPVRDSIGEGREALILALAIFSRLPRKEREQIRNETLFAAREGRDPDMRSLYRLLTGDELPC